MTDPIEGHAPQPPSRARLLLITGGGFVAAAAIAVLFVLPVEMRLDPTGFGTPSDFYAFKILEDTPTVHHVIVCALCSCYPRPILGNSPEWYRTPNYRRRIVRWPRPVLAEFGLQLPEDVEVRVADSNQKHRYMVMPMRPEGTEGWTEDQLAEIITRDSLIGVALPKPGITTNVFTATRPAIRPVAE